MGLDDLVPDDSKPARGGRPKEDTDKREVEGDPFVQSKDTENYWENVWKRFVAGTDPSAEEIANICDYTYLFPWDVKMHLEKHGIYEFDWEEVPDDYPSQSALVRMLDGYDIAGDFVEKTRIEEETDSEVSDGLAGLINDAKES